MVLVSTPRQPGDPIVYTQYNELRTDFLFHTHDGVDTAAVTLANAQYLQARDSLGTARNLIGISGTNVITIGVAGAGLSASIPTALTVASGLTLTAGNIAMATGAEIRFGSPAFRFVTFTQATTTYTFNQDGAAMSALGAWTFSGGVQVSAGNVGVGVSPANSIGVRLVGAVLGNGVIQAGLFSDATYSALSTSAGEGVYSRVTTAAAAFTMANAYAFYAAGPVKGAGSSITSAYGYFAESVTSGINNYGVYIQAPSGGTLNVGLYNLGTSRFDGSIAQGQNPLAYAALAATLAVTSDGVTGGYSVMNRNATITAAVNSDNLFGFAVQNSFALAAKTGVTCYGLDVSPSWAAAGLNYGIRVGAVTAGAVNYGVHITAPSGGGTNIGLYNGGSSQLVGSIGFFGTAPQAQQTITGSRAGNAALADLLTKLAATGLIVNSTTA